VGRESGADLVEPRRTHRGSPPRGVKAVTAVLQNGRVLWLRVSEPLATVAAATHLGQLADETARWRRAANRSQSDAIERLSQSIAADVERVSDGRLDRARARSRRLVAADRAANRKLSKAARDYRIRVERQLRIERESVRRLARRDLWDKLVILSSFPLFAAYGEPGRPFGANNLALTLSLLIWLVGDEIVDALFGREEKPPYPLRDADVWSYIAPLGNLLAGWWLLDSAQHERFVTSHAVIGPEPFTAEPNPADPSELLYRYTARIDLSPFVAPGHFPDFQTFTGVPAVATLASVRFSSAGGAAAAHIEGLVASVEEGTLIITVTAIANDLGTLPIPTIVDALEVAWMVDTREPSKTTSST
jgi:hypothetical protein